MSIVLLSRSLYSFTLRVVSVASRHLHSPSSEHFDAVIGTCAPGAPMTLASEGSNLNFRAAWHALGHLRAHSSRSSNSPAPSRSANLISCSSPYQVSVSISSRKHVQPVSSASSSSSLPATAASRVAELALPANAGRARCSSAAAKRAASDALPAVSAARCPETARRRSACLAKWASTSSLFSPSTPARRSNLMACVASLKAGCCSKFTPTSRSAPARALQRQRRNSTLDPADIAAQRLAQEGGCVIGKQHSKSP
mmetsp:Transcript_17686/g.55991  ORF Transcript_17686/g.55991 Transcript_17686/m.55991 type:complete len:255 (+) Transcript_17686:976-1740(+)